MRLAVFVVTLALVPASALAQVGIGGHFSVARADVETDTSGERFTGGQLRARVSPRSAIEVALDLRTETNEALTHRVRQYPIQASLLLYPLKTVFAPYLLGGGGWYSRRLETLVDSKPTTSVTTREFGWHGGFGAELRLGNHAGAHADYRYTFLKFGDGETDGTASATESTGFSRFLPSYRGSMWTAGLTIYF
jgi:hypothetical protein